MRALQPIAEANPYLIPDDDLNRTINFSGGRSSGYMLRKIMEVNVERTPLKQGGQTVVIFCNTGKERPETLDFVHEVEKRWGVPIVWLEYRYDPTRAGGRKDPKAQVKVVNWYSASRNGEPFESLIEKASILPNVKMRKCTVELKVETTRRYVSRILGWRPENTRRIVGIRHDEKKRWDKMIYEGCDVELPMVYAGVTEEDVGDFWKAQPFDLGISSARGNCDLCFLKGKGKLINTIREKPALADWWIEQEEGAMERWGKKFRKHEMARFSKRWTYRELRDTAVNTPMLPFKEDDGEDDDCNCTD